VPAFAFVSAKGSPGVTTAAAALAAAATTTGRALLAELDPSGGSVQILTGATANPGLIDVAGQLRREASAATVEANATTAPTGLPTLLAPTAGRLAESVVESAGARWVPVLRTVPDAQVMVDAGRWEPSQRSARRIVGADLVVVVCRPTVAGVEHTRHLLDRIRELARRPLVAVVVGDKPYQPAEVAAHFDIPLAGSLAWDPRGVSSLWAYGVTRPWLRTWLARSAVATLAGLTSLVEPQPAAALPTAPAPQPPALAPQHTAPAQVPAPPQAAAAPQSLAPPLPPPPPPPPPAGPPEPTASPQSPGTPDPTEVATSYEH
jgi:Flp pilus assembly CpaE family ATPase